jgi:hypothetical protein
MGAYVSCHLYYLVVGLPGFEPGTSASRTQRATKLRYSPRRVPSQPDNPTLWPTRQTKSAESKPPSADSK